CARLSEDDFGYYTFDYW
nr:immunoglobulin heavy chain junction region [Macaca mulatta]MOW78560.1 immunoglobulin heavy chain junction region [Macaca mulatta]MOW83196.1 immunoglobulin heavy chain junction region [Macaca mulatta]